MNRVVSTLLFFIYASFSLLLTSCESSKDTLQVKAEKDSVDLSSRVLTPTPPRGALSLAVLKGDVPQILELLTNGADINENVGKGEDLITPLFLSIAQANSQVTQLLLHNGADQNITYRGYSSRELAHFQALTRDVLGSFEENL